MAMFDLTVTPTPLDVSALLGVADGTSVRARAQNLSQQTVYRVVAATPPTDLDGAVWRYQPGESWGMLVYAGASDGNTYFAVASGEARVTLEDNLP